MTKVEESVVHKYGCSATRRGSVVVIDDHPKVREQLVGLLESHGFAVLAAVGTYADGQRVVSELSPQIAVIDHRLPDGLGADLCAELAEQCPEVIKIIHTGSHIEPARSSSALGAAAIVMKSARPRRLIDVMTALLNRSSASG